MGVVWELYQGSGFVLFVQYTISLFSDIIPPRYKSSVLWKVPLVPSFISTSVFSIIYKNKDEGLSEYLCSRGFSLCFDLIPIALSGILSKLKPLSVNCHPSLGPA